MQVLGPVAYRLELPETSKIHPVFHVSLLKKFRGDEDVKMVTLPSYSDERGPVLKPARVMDTRELIRQGQRIAQVLVTLETLPPEEATWIDKAEYDILSSNNHEDMVVVEGEGNDMDLRIDGLEQQNNGNEEEDLQEMIKRRPARNRVRPRYLDVYDTRGGKA